MQFDAALAAQETFKQAEAKFISHWDTAIEFEDACSSCVESTVRGVYEGCLPWVRTIQPSTLLDCDSLTTHE
jgi:hypothetical protein